MFIEGLRTDSLYVGNIRISQLIGFLCFVAGLSAIIGIRICLAKHPKAVVAEKTDDTPEIKETENENGENN